MNGPSIYAQAVQEKNRLVFFLIILGGKSYVARFQSIVTRLGQPLIPQKKRKMIVPGDDPQLRDVFHSHGKVGPLDQMDRISIEHYIEDPLSEAMLRGEFKGKNLIKISVQDEEHLKLEGSKMKDVKEPEPEHAAIGPSDAEKAPTD